VRTEYSLKLSLSVFNLFNEHSHFNDAKLWLERSLTFSLGTIFQNRATLKTGMTERRNGGITERRKMTQILKDEQRTKERQKITPNPKGRNRGTAE